MTKLTTFHSKLVKLLLLKRDEKAVFRAKIAAPNDKYTINPLSGDSIGNVTDYTANLNFINLDVRSLADQAKGSFYGSPKLNTYLVGLTSGAVAKVNDKKLITDQKGNLDVSFFIPNPKIPTILNLRLERDY